MCMLLQGFPLEGALKVVIPLCGKKYCRRHSTSRSAGLNCWKVRVPRVVRLPGFSSMVLFSTDSKRPTNAASEICSAHESHKNIFRIIINLVVCQILPICRDLRSGMPLFRFSDDYYIWLLWFILLCIGAWVASEWWTTFGGFDTTAASIFWRICLHSSVACMSPASAAATSCCLRSPSGVLAAALLATPCICPNNGVNQGMQFARMLELM